MRRNTSVWGGFVCPGRVTLAAGLLLVAQGCSPESGTPGVPVSAVAAKDNAEGFDALRAESREGSEDQGSGDEARCGFLYGEFVDAEGHLLPRITYTLTRKGGRGHAGIREARDGSFEIRGLDTEAKWRLATIDRRYVACCLDDLVASPSGTHTRVVLTPGFCLRVKVVDENGAPAPGADVQCDCVVMGETRRVLGYPSMPVMRGERELCGLPAGPCQIYVKAGGLLPRMVEVDLPLEGETQEGTIEIALSFGHVAQVRVLSAEDDQPIEAAVVTINGPGITMNEERRHLSPCAVKSTAEGIAKFSGFTEDVSFECRVEKEGFLQGSVSCRTGEESVVRLLRGARIVLTFDSEGRPLPARALISLYSPKSRDAPLRSLPPPLRVEELSLENGMATVTALWPSIYELTVKVSGFGEWCRGEIVIEGDETREIKVELRPEAVVRGHVCAEETGMPLNGVRVNFHVRHQSTFNGYTTTDSNGAYEFKGVPPGKVSISFSHPDWCQVTRTGGIAVEPGETLEIPVVSLARGGKIICRVRSSSTPIKTFHGSYTREGGEPSEGRESTGFAQYHSGQGAKEAQTTLAGLCPGNYDLKVHVNGQELKASATVYAGEVSEVTLAVDG